MTNLNLKIAPELLDKLNTALYWQGVKDGASWAGLAFIALVVTCLLMSRGPFKS